MKNICQNNEIEQIAQGLKNIINNQMQWRNNEKTDTNYGCKLKTKYVPISVTTTTFPTTTTTRTHTKHMLALHQTVII